MFVTERQTRLRRDEVSRADGHPVALLLVLGFSGTLVYCQQSVVLPLAPRLAALLHVDPAAASWVVTATLLTGATATPVFARLGDLFGKRRMLLVAIGSMAVGAVVCSISTSLGWLIVGRVIAGGGLGAMPLSMSILRDRLPADRLNAGVAAFGATAAIGIATGPVLGGLVDSIKVTFAVIAVLSALSMALVAWRVPVGERGPRVPVDLPGAALLTVIIVLTLLPMTMGREWGWWSLPTGACVAGAVIVTASWVPLELCRRHPFIDLRLNTRRPLLLTHVASSVAGLMMFGNAVLSSTILQAPRSTGYGMGLDGFHTGLTFLAGAAVMMLAAPLASRLLTARGARVTVIVGATIVGSCYGLRLVVHHHLSGLLLTFSAIYAGVALLVAALAVLAMQHAPSDRTTEVLGAQQVVRLGGQSASSSIIGAASGWWAVRIADTQYASWTAVVVCSTISVVAAIVCIVLVTAIGGESDTAGSRSWRSRRVPETLIEGNA